MANLEAREFTLRDGRAIVVRAALAQDAAAMLEYLECVSGESAFLTFGPGEVGMAGEGRAAALVRLQSAVAVRAHRAGSNPPPLAGSGAGTKSTAACFRRPGVRSSRADLWWSRAVTRCATRSSACLRSCRIFCASSGLSQKPGSLSFFSRVVSRSRFWATSKIAPHHIHALVKPVEAAPQIFQNHAHIVCSVSGEPGNSLPPHGIGTSI